MFSLFAVLLNGILGPLKNKVGGVIAASWKGINYVRAYAIPANPNTTAQQLQRTHFQQLGLFAKRVLTTIIQPYWDPFYDSMSGYNAFMQYHRLNNTPPFDYADLFAARGTLEGETIDSAVYAAGNVTVGWTASGLGNGEDTDTSVVLVVDNENDVAFVLDPGDARANEEAVLAIGTGRTVGELKCYLFFVQGTGEDMIVSNSDYAQVTV